MADPDVLDVVLSPDPRAAAHARQLVTEVSGPWSSTLVDVAKLLVSELVSNAIRHGQGDIGLRVRFTDRGLLRVEVSDASPDPPFIVHPPPSADEESGRGMEIVHALADSWGTRPGTESIGKTVWFELRASSSGRRWAEDGASVPCADT
jgi:anti-sigma regulatory factor (Ser/Thr protein kinase)